MATAVADRLVMQPKEKAPAGEAGEIAFTTP